MRRYVFKALVEIKEIFIVIIISIIIIIIITIIIVGAMKNKESLEP